MYILRIIQIVVLLIFALCHIATADTLSKLSGNNKVDYLRFFNSVRERIKREYVEPIDDKQLIEGALNGMLSSLDPHCGFLDIEKNKNMSILTKGEFGGLGIEITKYKNMVKIISPYQDAPAFKAGLLSGDFITAIDDELTGNLSIQDIADRLRGKPKTEVNLQIYRESTNEIFAIKIIREVITIEPVKIKIFDNNIAYINITTFNQKLSSLLHKKWAQLQQHQSINGIVLDLRWNPGGLFDQSLMVADFFLPKDKDIVSIISRKAKKQVFKSQSDDFTKAIPLVVLINEGSASASEIVAGAIQDHKRGLIIGQKSFGKSSVQTVISLPDNTAMKLTTARYYTPNGKSQADGIQPDIVVKPAEINSIEYNFIKKDSKSKNHLDNEQITKSEKKKDNMDLESQALTDYQLIRAIDMVKGIGFINKTR